MEFIRCEVYRIGKEDTLTMKKIIKTFLLVFFINVFFTKVHADEILNSNTQKVGISVIDDSKHFNGNQGDLPHLSNTSIISIIFLGMLILGGMLILYYKNRRNRLNE